MPNAPQDTNAFTYFPPERNGCWPAAIFATAPHPLGIVPRDWRSETPFMALLFAVIALFYAATTAHTVGLEDDALFIANLHFFGVAHPPGYPAHTFLGGIFYHLFPFGSPAYKAHLFSAVAGAGACVALYAIAAMLIQGRLFPALAALAYAVSKTFWSQAIIAEVYTLNAFLFFTLFALAIAYAGHPRPPRALLIAMAAITGIGIANHYPLFLLGGTGVALLTLPRIPHKFRHLPMAALVAAAAAIPLYLWMVWRSHHPIPANFYAEPIDTMAKFWFYVLREGYSSVDQQSGVTWQDKLAFARQFAGDIPQQFTVIGAALALAGFLRMACSRYQWLWLSLLCAFLASSAVLLILLNFQPGYIAFAVFRVYYLLAYGIMALWLAAGAAWTADLLAPRLAILWRRLAGAALLTAVVAGSAAAHWQINHRTDYTWAEDLARVKLQSVEPNAVLFLADDLDLPTYYLHTLLGERPDIDLYNDNGLILPNRLFSPLLPLYPSPSNPQTPSRAALLHAFIYDSIAPIYYNSSQQRLFTTQQHGSEFLGFYRRVNRESSANRTILQDHVKAWLRDNLSDQNIQHDPWTRFQQYETISQVMNAVVESEQAGALVLTDDWRDIIRAARAKNAKTRVLTNFIRMDGLDAEELAAEAAWMDSFDINKEPLMDKFGRGRFYLLRAQLAQRIAPPGTQDNPDYEASLKRALEEDERINNPGLGWLLDYYAQNPDHHCAYLALSDHYYPDLNTIPPARLAELRQVRRTALC